MPNLVWDLAWRDRGVVRGLNDVSGASDKAERKAKAFRVAVGVGFVVAGAAAIRFGRDSVRAYSEAQDAQKALGFAFQKFPALADTNQAALQRLNSEIQKKTRFDDDNIASGQAVLAQFRLTGKQITDVTPLLTDYASKTGKDIPNAARDVGKALLGNAKALKNIGISYKSTGDAGKDFTNITALMREKVGGFAELEGKTATGRLAILNNQFGELQEAVGTHLVPALSEGVVVLTDLVEVVGENSDVIVPLVGGVAGLTAALWLGHKAAKAYAVVQGLMGAAMTSNSRVATGLASVVGKAGPWGLAIGAGATLLGLFAGKQELAKRETKAFTDSLTFQSGALDDNSRQMLAKKLADEGALDAAKRAGVSEADYVRALLQGGPARDAVINQLFDTEEAARANADALNGNVTENLDLAAAAGTAADQLRLTGGSLDESKRKADLASSGFAGATTATEDLGAAQKTLNAELQKSIDKFTILKEGALSTERANMAWEESVDAVRESTKRNGKSLDGHTEKGRSNRTAVIGMITALNDKVTADVKNAGAIRKGETAQERYERVQKTATRATKDGTEKLREHARRAGLNKDQVNAMIDEFLKTPSAAGKMGKSVERAATKVDRLGDEIGGLTGKEVRIKFGSNAGDLATKYGIIISRPSTSLKGGSQSSARGGVLRGWSPGRDIHRFVSPTGGELNLSGGEAVMVPEWTRAVGGPGAVARMNSEARGQHFAAGGVISVRAGAVQGMSAPHTFDVIGDRIAGHLGNRIGAALAKRFAVTGGGVTGPAGPMTSFRGGRFTSLGAANLRRAEQIAGMTMHIMQGGWRHPTSYSGTSHAGDAVDTQASPSLIRALRSVDWASGDRTGLGNWGSHAHSVPGPGAGRAGGSAVWQYQDYLRRGGASQGLGSPWGLASGGVLTARVAEEGPERLLTAHQTRAYDRMVRVAETRGVGGTTVINISAPNYIGSRDELRQALVDMNRRGQLEVIKR